MEYDNIGNVKQFGVMYIAQHKWEEGIWRRICLRWERNARDRYFTTRVTIPTFTCLLFSFFFISLKIQALHTYLSHSSTLNVGVLAVVGGELCLLTRWFRDVSCTLSRFPRIARLWFANFSLFMGEPRTTMEAMTRLSAHYTENSHFSFFFLAYDRSTPSTKAIWSIAAWHENIRERYLLYCYNTVHAISVVFAGIASCVEREKRDDTSSCLYISRCMRIGIWK